MEMRLLITMLLVFGGGHANAFGLGDVKDLLDSSDKCESGDQGCKNREHVKTAVKVAAVTLIAKMMIDHQSKRVAEEAQVAKEYQDQHDSLPAEPTAVEYVTKTLPGNVVKPGGEVVIQSDIVVVPGAQKKQVLIEERITIYDNEDNSKELKSLTKSVNETSKDCGRYQNEFTFTLPEGLPQGVYPVKTQLLLNGDVVDDADNDIQLVMIVDEYSNAQMLAGLDFRENKLPNPGI